jgi:hypothetical protein
MTRISSWLFGLFVFGAVDALNLLQRDASTCCPQGEFTGSLGSACNSTSVANFGDGQCYNDWQISCTGNYPNGAVLAAANQSTISLDTCNRFCTANAPGFTSLNVIISQRLGFDLNVLPYQCQCMKLASNFQESPPDSYYGASLASCPLPNACCEPYTGDLNSACTNSSSPTYGNGKCYKGLIINCLGASGFGHVDRNLGSDTFEECVNDCNQLSPTSLGVSYYNGAIAPGSCQCTGFSYAFSAEFFVISLLSSPYPICAPGGSSSSSISRMTMTRTTSSSRPSTSTRTGGTGTSSSTGTQSTSSSPQPSGGMGGHGGSGGSSGSGGNGGKGAAGVSVLASATGYIGAQSNVAPIVASSFFTVVGLICPVAALLFL